jgi:hypothetical protein
MNHLAVQHASPVTVRDSRRHWPVQLPWLGGGLALSFAIPFVGADLMGLPLNAYYFCYFVLVLSFLGVYARKTDVDLRALIHRRWAISLVLGLLAGAFVVARVLSGAATPRPDGAQYAFELAWRGVLYGAVDALLLTVFPCLVTLGLLGGDIKGVVRQLGYVACSLVLILTVTATYHLGFEQFRRDGIGAPIIGNTMISLPMLLTTNPIGSVLAHASMHVTAAAHAYETPTFLPPQVGADGRRALLRTP